MEDFLKRMLIEQKELEDRLEKLGTALSSKGFAEKVGVEQYTLMIQQLNAMVTYDMNLSLRIKLLEEE